MSLKSILLKSLLFIWFFSSNVFAGDLEWAGAYRIEANSIENPSIKTGDKRAKEYGVHHIMLRPKIVAADGLYINSQFHIFNDSVGGPQLGSVWGSAIKAPAGASNYASANSDRNEEESFAVSEFYLTFIQEYGSLILGRAPLHFGLGMTYNAGKGPFDHYYDNRDLAGYKIVMGNFFFMPIIAKLKEGSISGFDDISETLVHIQYESVESNTAMGFMYADRRAGSAGNDTPTDAGSQFGPETPYAGRVSGSFNMKTMNIFFTKKWSKDRVGFEIVNQTGDFGVNNSMNEGISQAAFAAAFEYERNSKSHINWGVNAGWASGDDPSTDNEYEGYVFDRNYDVATLMFNHSLGRTNFLRTESLGTRFGTSRNGSENIDSATEDPDSDAISNVMYFAPYITYKWRDAWTIKGVLATGYLDQDVFFGKGTADRDLGYEFDLSLIHKPNEHLLWENTFAVFLPGAAFELDGNTSAAYGLVSRATISF